MMTQVLVYGYASGVFFSRRITRRLQEDIAFRVLAAGNFAAHRTIGEFRHVHLTEFSALFVQVAQLARKAGPTKLERIGIDGTGVRAHASRHKAMICQPSNSGDSRCMPECRLLDRPFLPSPMPAFPPVINGLRCGFLLHGSDGT